MFSAFVGRICVLLLLVTTYWHAAAQEEKNSAFVTVKVLDPAGRPVSNARVHFLERSSRNEKDQTTSETGTTTVELQPGTFDLTVTSPEFLFLMMRDVEVKRGDHRQLDVVLKAKGLRIIDFVDFAECVVPETAKLGNLEESVRKPVLLFVAPGGVLDASGDECEWTARMRVYSNASLIKEADDVVGYELAVQQREDTSVDALLYPLGSFRGP